MDSTSTLHLLLEICCGELEIGWESEVANAKKSIFDLQLVKSVHVKSTDAKGQQYFFKIVTEQKELSAHC